VTGILLGLAAALCWGLSSLVGSRGARALGTTRNLAFAVVGGLVVVAPPAVVTAPVPLAPYGMPSSTEVLPSIHA